MRILVIVVIIAGLAAVLLSRNTKSNEMALQVGSSQKEKSMMTTILGEIKKICDVTKSGQEKEIKNNDNKHLNETLKYLKDMCPDRYSELTQEQMLNIKRLDLSNLSGEKVDLLELHKLKKLCDLTSLDLSFTTIAEGQLKELSSLPKLEILNLWGANISDIAFSELKKLKALRQIDLRDSNIIYESFDSLKEALPLCEIRR